MECKGLQCRIRIIGGKVSGAAVEPLIEAILDETNQSLLNRRAVETGKDCPYEMLF